jgi:phospholipid/cholesterol/gamma-HCH transport system substrate-binding protein
MDKSRLEWKVGLFVFISLVVLAVLLLQFSKGMTIFRSSYRILLHSPNVVGLKARAAVLLSGVQVGTVSDIRLVPEGTNATITLRIYGQYRISTNATFVIEQSGFLGDQYVAITLTNSVGGCFRDGDAVNTEAPFNLQEAARSANSFIQRLDKTAQNLNEAIEDIRKHTLNQKTLTNLSEAIGEFRLVSEHVLTTVDNINALVETNRPAVAVSVSNLVVFTRQANQFGEQANQFADSLSDLVATNSPRITAAVAGIQGLVDDLQAGKGLAGDLLKDETMATNMAQILSNLSITSSNLNRLGLWGILWKQKPPRTNSPPPAALTSPKNPFN